METHLAPQALRSRSNVQALVARHEDSVWFDENHHQPRATRAITVTANWVNGRSWKETPELPVGASSGSSARVLPSETQRNRQAAFCEPALSPLFLCRAFFMEAV